MFSYLQKQSPTWLKMMGFSLIGLLAIFDFLTGPQLSFSIFYLLPITMLAWYGGRQAGLIAAFAGGLAWLGVDLLSGQSYAHPAIPYWNAAVRLGFFAIITVILSSLKAAQDRHEELQQFIVHDLRAPLSNMMTGLQLLDEMVRETGGADELQLIQTGQVSANRMLILINSLLDMARLESGQLPLRIAQVSVSELLEQAAGDVALWAEQKSLVLAASCAAGAEAALADPAITGRVLTNLLGNAIKFSPHGSTIRLAAMPATGGALAISIADQGDGVPAEWAGRVFDKYAQVASRRQRGSQGFGLGLAFCRLAVEAQGGRIWLDSPPAGGTVVTFTLPTPPPGAFMAGAAPADAVPADAVPADAAPAVKPASRAT